MRPFSILVVSLLLLFSTALAEASNTIDPYNGFCGNSITWALSDEGVLTLSGEGETYDYTSKGAPWYDRREEIISISINYGISTLNSYLFEDLNNLTSVSFAKGVNGFSSRVFVNCPKLETLILPDYISMWGSLIISNCNNLTVYLKSSCSNIIPSLRNGNVHFVVTDADSDFIIEDGILEAYIGSDSSVEIPNGITEIGWEAFGYNNHVESVIVSEGVLSIQDHAFQHCHNLHTIQLPTSLKTLGRGSFKNCTSLRSISIPDGMVSISQECFWDCTSLHEVHLPSSITNIAYGAFANCSALKNVFYVGTESSKERIWINNEYGCNQELLDATWHFSDASVLWFYLPSNIQHIDDEAFFGTSIPALHIPESCLSIGEKAFANCPDLCNLYIPSSVTSIDPSCINDSPNVIIHCPINSAAYRWAVDNNYQTVIE